MLLPVTRYSALRKQDPSGKFRVFSALRAVGLAVELGHKAAQTKGPLAVQTDDLLQVSVAGNLKVLQGRGLVDVRKVSLALRPQDAELAKVVLLKQLSLFRNAACFDPNADFGQFHYLPPRSL